MKKFLAPVIVAALLCGNLVLSETQRHEIMLEREDINEEYIYFYELTISNPELTGKRKDAYVSSYRTYLIDMGNEYLIEHRDLYAGLIEE
jgi:hypothetical protein